MASGIRAIKAAIAAKLAAVAGLSSSTIHPRTRNWGGANEAYFEALFTAGGKVNGWEIEHESCASEYVSTNLDIDRRDVIALRGYYGISDADDSEGTFSQIVESVKKKLDADQSIGGAVGVRTHGTAQIRSYGAAMLGGKLVHFAEIALTIAWAQRVQ